MLKAIKRKQFLVNIASRSFNGSLTHVSEDGCLPRMVDVSEKIASNREATGLTLSFLAFHPSFHIHIFDFSIPLSLVIPSSFFLQENIAHNKLQ